MAYSKLSLTAAFLVFSVLVATIPSGNAGKIVTQWKWIGKCRSLQQCRISCLAKGYGNQYTDEYDFLVMLDLEKTSTVCGCPLVYKEDSWQSDLPATTNSDTDGEPELFTMSPYGAPISGDEFYTADAPSPTA